MSETKLTGIRADSETTTRFKKLAEQFPNSGECLKSLLNAHEMAQAKEVLPGQSTSIDDFRSHLDSIATAYIGVLDLIANTENRIRQEFQRQLESKDGIIADLQERIKQAESDLKTTTNQATIATAEFETRAEQFGKEVDSLQEELEVVRKQSVELSDNLAVVKNQVTDKQQIIDNLNQKISETATAIKKADEAEARALKADSELKAVKSELAETEKRYESEVKELTQQLASQRTTAEQSAKVAERLAEADKKEALANQKEKYIEELNELRQKIQARRDETFNLKLLKKI